MSNILIIYKGDFFDEVAGVAVRYLAVAEEMIKEGNEVTIAGRKVPEGGRINFIKTACFFGLLKVFLRSDKIILHGGGPLILLLAAFFSWRGKVVLLDSFAPHWIELYCSPRENIGHFENLKVKAKVIINYLRLVWAELFFDKITVGTEKQLDLVRGIVSMTGRLQNLKNISIVTGGCEPFQENYKKNKAVIKFGWLGGLWDWFDIDPLLRAIVELNKEKKQAKIVFYGVNEVKKKYISQRVIALGGDFDELCELHGWVPYKERLNEWKEIDVSIVWAANTLENDYASRTRNFDCISLGIPIIQNEDFFWADIIKKNNVGTVVKDVEELANAMRFYVENRDTVTVQSENIRGLVSEFEWKKIAKDYECALKNINKKDNVFKNILVAFFIIPVISFSFFVSNFKSK